jgi:hypothetical protein
MHERRKELWATVFHVTILKKIRGCAIMNHKKDFTMNETDILISFTCDYWKRTTAVFLRDQQSILQLVALLNSSVKLYLNFRTSTLRLPNFTYKTTGRAIGMFTSDSRFSSFINVLKAFAHPANDNSTMALPFPPVLVLPKDWPADNLLSTLTQGHEKSTINHENLESAFFKECTIKHSMISDSWLSDCNIMNCLLMNCHIENSKFETSSIQGGRLLKTSLRGSSLSRGYWARDCNFRKCYVWGRRSTSASLPQQKYCPSQRMPPTLQNLSRNFWVLPKLPKSLVFRRLTLAAAPQNHQRLIIASSHIA